MNFELEELFFMLLFLTLSTFSAATPHEQEIQAAWQAAEKVMTKGPAEISLINQTKLKLPAGYVFVPKAEAERIMKSYGNTGENLIGLITSVNDNENWIATFKYASNYYNVSEHYNYFPIPSLEISVNNQITSNNPGW